MSDKRKSSTEIDGKFTIRRNRIGSGYKNESKFVVVEESLEGVKPQEIVARINNSYNPEVLIGSIEKDIMKWLASVNLLKNGVYIHKKDTETIWNFAKIEKDMTENGYDDCQEFFQKHVGSYDGYCEHTKVDYEFEVGELSAASCLKLIEEIKIRVKNKMDHFYTLCSALELARVYKLWFANINEGVFSRDYETDRMISSNRKLSENQLERAINYYHDSAKKEANGRKITNKKRRLETVAHLKEKYNIKIKEDTLRKKIDESLK